MAQHIRKGDLVQVIAGDAKGTQATVLRVYPRDNKVLVQGVNVCRKHVRPSQNNPRGGIMEKEVSIHISNVMPVVDGKPTRVRFKTNKNGEKIRVAASNGSQIGAALRSTK